MPISGTVTDADGNTVDGATVVAIDQADDEIIGSTTTASDGTYSISASQDTDAHVLVEYDDGSTWHHDFSYPWVAVESDAYIDTFDSWDGSNYSGDTSMFTSVSSPAVSGSALGNVSDEDYYHEIVSTSGLSNYPAKGNRFEIYVQGDTLSSKCDVYMLFGAADGSNMYRARLKLSGGYMWLEEQSSGSSSDLAEGGVDWAFSENTYYKLEVTWDDGSINGTDNEITMTVYDQDGTDPQSISAVDNTHAGNTGWGVAYAIGATSKRVYYDEGRITE